MFTRKVSTKVNAAATAVETSVTVDFTGVSQEKLEELASATVIINEQAVWRTSGVIPGSATINVAEQLGRPRGGGFKATPESLAKRISAQPEAEYRETLKNLGLGEKEIDKMAKAKYGEAK